MIPLLLLLAAGDVGVEVRAQGVARQDPTVEVRMSPPREGMSYQVRDRAGRTLASQYDSSGTLVFAVSGILPANQAATFTVSAVPRAPEQEAPITVTEGVEDEGQKSFRIATPRATYFYHEKGAGFSSMLDADGNDWLGFRPQGGSDGKYRGIPNLVHPEGYFHPGSTNCISKIIDRGPVKVTIESSSENRGYTCRWEIYRTFARLTVLKFEKPYWFLYEGTPGGKLDMGTDYCVRSDGTRTPASQKWTGDLPSPEWLYFGDENSKRVLFLAHHEDDEHVDSYWPMQKNMTVFGFGRDGLGKFMKESPNRFTIGFSPAADHPAVMKAIRAAVTPLDVRIRK